MVSLKDIAAQAEVSVMTVSKALRDAPDIAKETKARLRQIADQMGYVPNLVARNLRSRTTRLFGLVISAATNPLFTRVVMALEEQAHESGYDLLVGHSLNLPEREDAIIRRMLARQVDGLFLSPVYRLAPTAPIYDELLRRGIPTVLLGHVAPFCRPFAHVETEDLDASYKAAKHLLDLGHRRIAFLSGPAVAPWAQERLEGYRRALREARLEPDERLVLAAGSRIEDGEKAAEQWLAEALPATAMLGINDLVAIGAANTFLRHGRQIPQDLSVVGFGNILVSEHYRVPLTTIQQPKRRLGLAAMELMRLLLRGQPAESRRLPAELIVRQSTAPPPAKVER